MEQSINSQGRAKIWVKNLSRIREILKYFKQKPDSGFYAICVVIYSIIRTVNLIIEEF